MANLVSPGVSVTVENDSFFIPATAATVPLIFIATQDEKTQSDGITPAAGTYEYNVVRSVSGLGQSAQLYGIPSFLKDSAGNPMHGDARNEVGLLALNNFLTIGGSAYVVRANVNLNDNEDAIVASWTSKILNASYVLQNNTISFINQFNAANGYGVGNANYKTTVSASELIVLAQQSTADIFALDTFTNAKAPFFTSYIDTPVSTSGSQVVSFGGAITAGTLPTNLGTGTYTTTVNVDGVNFPVSISGPNAATYNALVTQLNTALGAVATVTIANGNILITSDSVGSLSAINITDTNLFGSLNGYVSLLVPIPGVLAEAAIPVYGNGFSQSPTSTFAGFVGMTERWATDINNPTAATVWTPAQAAAFLIEAAGEYAATISFLNATALGANDAARRVSIATALTAVINSNSEIRSENYQYNLIVCPGFPEVTGALDALANEVLNEAFVISSLPCNLAPDAAAAWGTSSARVVSTNVAYYYPGGLTTNLDGNTVYMPADGIALNTYTYSDNVSGHVHFAPAGSKRGVVQNVSKCGYISGTLGLATTFVETNLNLGQRNSLYQYGSNINPITNTPRHGILVMGQKTSAGAASAEDRVNVMRMLCQLRRDLRVLAFEFLFEPNDQITRNGLLAAANDEMTNLVRTRGLYDYASLCDSTNNPPSVVDQNELYLDIALQPMKDVEFIYIPIRVLADSAALVVT